MFRDRPNWWITEKNTVVFRDRVNFAPKKKKNQRHWSRRKSVCGQVGGFRGSRQSAGKQLYIV